MESNEGTESTNPPNIVTIETAINTLTTSVPTAWPGPAAGIPMEPQSLDSVPPTGKRQRTSSPNGNRRQSSGQMGYSLSDTAIPSAPPQLSTYPGNATSFVPVELRQHHLALQLQQQQQQPQGVAQNNSQILQSQQLQGMYGLPSAQSLVHPNMNTLIMANQLRQAGGTAPFLQMPTVQPNNELQQLMAILQQHQNSVALAQALGINLPPSRDAVGSSFPSANQSFAPPSSQMLQQFVINSDTFPSTLQATAAGNDTNNLSSDAPPSIHARSNDTLAQMNRALPTAPPNDSNVSSRVSGRPPIQIYMSCDDDSLSEYQCLVRKHIELFEAGVDDVESNAQGRNRPIVLGQVGIRCRHCTMLPPRSRCRGAMYYPAKLQGIYQAAQNLAVAHLGENCQNVPEDVRATLIKLREHKSSAGGGKQYWSNGARVLGVFEDRDGLRFVSQFTPSDGAIL